MGASGLREWTQGNQDSDGEHKPGPGLLLNLCIWSEEDKWQKAFLQSLPFVTAI